MEPDQHMLAKLRREMPSVPSVPGSAEEIPLPDGSADAVLVGQAMHWFDMDRAMPEIARVLAPGGVLAGLWNTDDDPARLPHLHLACALTLLLRDPRLDVRTDETQGPGTSTG